MYLQTAFDLERITLQQANLFVVRDGKTRQLCQDIGAYVLGLVLILGLLMLISRFLHEFKAFLHIFWCKSLFFLYYDFSMSVRRKQSSFKIC